MDNDLIKKVFYAFLAIAIFTLVDYLFHFIPYFAVPPTYFFNKLLVGTVVLFFGMLWFPRSDKKIIWITAITVIALQFRYYSVYAPVWNILVVLVHFGILYYTIRLLNQQAQNSYG